MTDPTLLYCIIGGVLVGGIMLVATAVRIVPEYQRLVVFRLGRCIGDKGPGIILLIPMIDKARRVDLREQVREIPHQTSITKDNAAIAVDFLWYYKILDPTASVLNIDRFERAAEGMATTTLRAVIGGITLDEVLSEREKINNLLRNRLDDATHRWGVKVTNVEIREIIPPKEISDAMNRQMSAERDRRAQVTASTGEKEAAINIAAGNKQASILEAEGDRQSAILRSEGYAEALNKIFAAAEKIDQKTLTLQYFETLKEIGKGESTKYIIPMEFTSLIGNFIDGQKKK